MSTKAREVKVVLLGDTGVGKSSLVLRFVTKNFRPFSESTIGASFMSKMIMIEGKAIKYQIWDTAGQEKYRSLAPMYYRGAAAAIIVYDITSLQSFKKCKNWVKELQSYGPEDIVLVVAGNKVDLVDQREVDTAVASQYANEIGALFIETSAKSNTNVAKAFEQISTRLKPDSRDNDFALDPDDGGRHHIGLNPGDKKDGGCC